MKTIPQMSKALFLFLFAILMMPTLHAQDNPADVSKTQSPYFVVISDNPENEQLPLKETTVDANIVGSIADVTVKQVYVNTGRNPIEAIYTFPLSTKAAVYGMQMTIGSRLIQAEIQEKSKARDEYEKAKAEGKRASLLEQSRPNVFTMNVTNIMVGDTIEVQLKYTELLVPEKGQYTFVYPTVVGPRYSSPAATQSGTDDAFVGSPYTKSGKAPTYKFRYNLTINSAVPIHSVACTSHKMNISYPVATKSNITLDHSETAAGNRDVIVSYSLMGNDIQSGMLLYEGTDENYFLMMVQPPHKVPAQKIPPREYIFVVDVSGSMYGFPLNITKSLMRNLILNLNPTDHFNLLLFSGATHLLSPQSLPATRDNLEKALSLIDRQHGGGGTEVLQALQTAYALPRHDSDVSRAVVIVTDGYVSVEKEAFEMIRKNNDNTNFFAFGIGSSVNRYLIEGMAFVGNGEPMIITSADEASLQAERFRSYINSPLLTHIKFNSRQFQAYDIEPLTVPDMMAERPVMIFGKYKGTPEGTVTLTGRYNRKPYSQTFKVADHTPESANAAICQLWARERIKYLDYLVGPHGANERDSKVREITRLGFEYNLVTNYTSFIAVDHQIVNQDGKTVTVKQPLPIPQGVSDYAVGNRSFALKSVSVNTFDAVSVQMDEDEESEVFVVVEQMPEFPGGNDSLISFLSKNIIYPEKAKAEQIHGRVYVRFVVEKDGSITNAKIIRDIGGGCGEEVLRVISLMPKWNPGKQGGKPVRTEFMLPVSFSLTE